MTKETSFLRVVPSRTADVLASDYKTRRCFHTREEEFDWIEMHNTDDVPQGVSYVPAVLVIILLTAIAVTTSLLF